MASELRVDKIIPTGGVPTGGGGGIIQVKNTLKTDTFTTQSTSFTDVTGLSVTITASSASNKILVMVNVFAACQDSAMLRVVKDGTAIAAGSGGSGGAAYQGFAFVRNNSTSSGSGYAITFLDSPADTNPHTYKVQCNSENGSSYPVVVNRRVSDTTFQLSSSITAMEVSA